jgi:hypothetical protein
MKSVAIPIKRFYRRHAGSAQENRRFSVFINYFLLLPDVRTAAGEGYEPGFAGLSAGFASRRTRALRAH